MKVLKDIADGNAHSLANSQGFGVGETLLEKEIAVRSEISSSIHQGDIPGEDSFFRDLQLIVQLIEPDNLFRG